MKNIMILLMLTMLSCKSGKNTTLEVDKKEALLYYSKGPCAGKCPVYDFMVFPDGTAVYNGIAKVDHKGELKHKLSAQQISDLTALLKTNLNEPKDFREIRDIPVTTLRFDDKKYQYHATRTEGTLKKIDENIQSLLAKVMSNIP